MFFRQILYNCLVTTIKYVCMQPTRQLKHKGRVCYSAKTNLLKEGKKKILLIICLSSASLNHNLFCLMN